jgi:hypothetical protein
MPVIDVMLWNKGKTESVRASKIRSFGIYPEHTVPGEHPNAHKLLGWFNANEEFYFGWWDTKKEAQAYLEELHALIEGRATSV